MKPSVCPSWIDPGNALRFLVRVAKYVANLEYGMLPMSEQDYDWWVDISSGYNLDKFHDEMASKIIWGPSQEIRVWGLDTEIGTECKLTTNEEFGQWMNSMLDDKLVEFGVEVIYKKGYEPIEGIANPVDSAIQGVSGVVTADPIDQSSAQVLSAMISAEVSSPGHEEGTGDTSSHPQNAEEANVVVELEDDPDMSVGTFYPSMDEFRMAVKQYAIVHEFELETEKSDKERFRGKCHAIGCPWIIRAKTQPNKSVRVQINKYDHKCASRSRFRGRMASQAWVAERAIPFLNKKNGMGPKELQKELQDTYKITIPYHTVYHGRKKATDKLFGKWSDSFDWLYRFKAEVEMRSPGSVVEIDTVKVGDKVHFSRFFCAFKASIDGFLGGCRPYISIDSTALNGYWNGHMPAANALDGHNWMFPLAFGFFDSETKENWVWFMEQLANAIGPVPKLAIHTDACKGLETAVHKVFPWAEQRECMRHLMENMKKLFHGSIYVRKMWPAAKTYMLEKHDKWMDEVTTASPEVKQWLKEYHNILWARSKFDCAFKCDYINNNLAESWNSWIKDLKDLPVDALADAIRENTLILFEKRRRISTALNGVILPVVIHQLNEASKGLGHLKVTKGNPDQAEVTETYKDEFQAAYESVIPNITDKKQWPKVDKGFKLLPPVPKKRGVGRQRKNRIPSALEKGKGKAARQVQCPDCQRFGHRKGSVRCELTGTRKRKKNNKTKTNVGRKKAKGAIDAQAAAVDVQANTPRTRAVAAKEATAESQVHATQTSSPGPITRRRLALEVGQSFVEVALVPVQVQAAVQPTKKLTPRKKLASKPKRASPPKLLK
ncbi:uncharacterized protein LOC127773379 [Oryza glaberrima]|uniref:uncharacterized protein LOC127773379 n=1 Tax=Oryza glaberrima TaxID=4538 RepID=UPI00224C1BE5|nr:uncharacterized protein LOC127773379 [Oryza glaberrima]